MHLHLCGLGWIYPHATCLGRTHHGQVSGDPNGYFPPLCPLRLQKSGRCQLAHSLPTKTKPVPHIFQGEGAMVILMVHHSASVIMSFSLYIHLPTSFLQAMWSCPMIMRISVAQKNTYLWRGLNIAFWTAQSFYHVLWWIKYVQIKSMWYVMANHIMEHADEIYYRIMYGRVLTDRISIHIIQGLFSAFIYRSVLL